MTVSWERVWRVVFEARHQYRYEYSAPISSLDHALRVLPPRRRGDQRLLAYHLSAVGTDPGSTIVCETDRFHNSVHRVRSNGSTREVCFEAWYRVERRASLAHDGCAGYVSRPTRRYDVFLTPTRLTEPSEETQAAAWQIASEGGSLAEQAELAHEWTGSTLAYKFGVTGVHTTATEALRLGQGVCQDYAHILLTLLRQLSIPARYVSGLLPGSGAPHAWVEALLPLDGRPGRRWVPFDPTNQKRPDLQYLAIAVGRDFNDITITSGVYAGAASGTLTCTNQTSVVEIEELPGRAL